MKQRKPIPCSHDEAIPGHNVPLFETPVAFTRAGGDVICETCHKPYWKHPYGGPVGYDGHQFLKLLCNGKLVKL